MELIKGGFPARYGGRLSSVIDISMKEGNMKEFHGEGGIGLISSRLTLEGPILKDKASFIVSGRRTYFDILARPFIKAFADGDGTAGYYFYDLNGKINYKFSDKDRLYLSSYMGDDRFYSRYTYSYHEDDTFFEEKNKAGLNWGNITTALRWNHMISQKLFSNTTFTYSRYRFNIYEDWENIATKKGESSRERFYMEYFSGIRDFALKVDFDYLPGPDHYIKTGLNVIKHRFNPGALAVEAPVDDQDFDLNIGDDPVNALEHALYVEDDYKVNDKLKINAGLHYSGFAVRGRHYNSLQPRISSRYLIGPSLSFKASYARMTQYIHLLTNSGIGLPTDLWVPVTEKILPQQSHQVALGLAKTVANNYELSLEGYYKTMDNLLEYKEGSSFFEENSSWEDKVTKGKGRSYGAEFFLQKKTGKTTGWIGYTLAWANRQFEELNEGKLFPYKYDRRHDVSLVVTHRFNERTELSGTWVYGTGVALTLPTGTYKMAPDPLVGHHPQYFMDYWNSVNNFSDRNQYRMPHYHRLDLAISRFKKTKWGERRWVYGIYNAYNRLNPFYIDITHDRNGKKQFTQYSVFQLIPSVSYNFTF